MSNGTKIMALILAGGNSERMGFPKPFLPFEKRTLLEFLVEKYSGFAERICVVINQELLTRNWLFFVEPISAKAHIIPNHFPHKGRFFSIRLGLKYFSLYDYCFIQNVDNPVKDETLKQLLAHTEPKGYSVPLFNNKSGHPILISAGVAKRILSLPEDNDYNLRDILKDFKKKKVAVNNDWIHHDLNTPADLEKYLDAA